MVQPAIGLHPPLIPKRTDYICHLRIPSHHHAALTGRDRFIGIETKHPEISNAADGPPPIAGSDGLAGVLNHGQTMPSCDVHDGIEVGWMSERVDYDNGTRSRGDTPL